MIVYFLLVWEADTFGYRCVNIFLLVMHGSGGRDLSGNRRTNEEQSFDQKFEGYNEALRVSCKNGYPVRVIR